MLAASALVRGRMDLGNPEVQALMADLRAALPDYDTIHGEVRNQSKKDVIAWLLAELD